MKGLRLSSDRRIECVELNIGTLRELTEQRR